MGDAVDMSGRLGRVINDILSPHYEVKVQWESGDTSWVYISKLKHVYPMKIEEDQHGD